jgi:transcription termination factor NusB
MQGNLDTKSDKDLGFEKKINKERNIVEIKQKELTHRIRLSRIAAVQSLYAIDIKSKSAGEKNSLLFEDNFFAKESVVDSCENTLYYYRTIIFEDLSYLNFKNKKIDEAFLIDLVSFAAENMQFIDSIIQIFLKNEWRVPRLDYIIRNILRISTAETIQRVIKKVKKYKDKEAIDEKYKDANIRINVAIITSEYTNISGLFYNEQMTGFANSVLDKIVNYIIANHDQVLSKINAKFKV